MAPITRSKAESAAAAEALALERAVKAAQGSHLEHAVSHGKIGDEHTAGNHHSHGSYYAPRGIYFEEDGRSRIIGGPAPFEPSGPRASELASKHPEWQQVQSLSWITRAGNARYHTDQKPVRFDVSSAHAAFGFSQNSYGRTRLFSQGVKL